jgi:adenosylhomocysteine nucleosidase
MKKILITYALEEEKGKIQIPNCAVSFCCTGIGKVSTAIHVYKAVLKEKPDLAINIGSGGSLNWQIGDILICSSFIDRDLAKISFLGVTCLLDFKAELKAAGILKNHELNATVSTGDTFLTGKNESGADGDVFDMEAYAGAQVCKDFGIPYISIKYVTDIIGQNSIKHWEDKLLEARENLAAFIRTLRI